MQAVHMVPAEFRKAWFLLMGADLHILRWRTGPTTADNNMKAPGQQHSLYKDLEINPHMAAVATPSIQWWWGSAVHMAFQLAQALQAALFDRSPSSPFSRRAYCHHLFEQPLQMAQPDGGGHPTHGFLKAVPFP